MSLSSRNNVDSFVYIKKIVWTHQFNQPFY